MIHLELGEARIFVRPGATDLRKQINGLVVLVQEEIFRGGRMCLTSYLPVTVPGCLSDYRSIPLPSLVEYRLPRPMALRQVKCGKARAA